MHETEEDLKALQRILDESDSKAGDHLRSIFTTERRLDAEGIAAELRGVFVLHLATVTASCEPIVAPIDGLFYRGRLWFGIPPGGLRARHLRSRSQVSAVYTVGEDVCVMAHGVAREVNDSDPEHEGYLRYCREVYGSMWDYWQERYRDREEPGFTAWIEPRRMYAVGPRPA